MEPTIYKPSIYKGAGIYKNGGEGGGGGGETVKIGGKIYPVVTIDGKKWLGENLSFIFPEASINPSGYLSTPSIFYNLISEYTYGYLYNWYAAKYINDNNLIPGWRVANLTDYQNLISFVGGAANVPRVLYDKNWKNDSLDEYDFAIKPAGIWTGSVGSQGINLNTGTADFVCLDLADVNKEYHLECSTTSASIKFNAIGAGRSIRLIEDETRTAAPNE